LAAGIYIGLSFFYQRQWDELPITRSVSWTVSWVSLGILVLYTLLFLTGRTSLDTAKWFMTLTTVLWFTSASLWMGKEPRKPAPVEATKPELSR
jgi:hypothetical protein